jgi:hypothetical protein
MYDMYPWDSASQGDYPPPPLRSVRDPARRAAKPRPGPARTAKPRPGPARDIAPAQAVQVALDRRDNGGQARPAGQAAAAPAASQARQ